MLTSIERAKIREYLGWGTRFFQIDTALETAMDAIEGFPNDEAQVRAALAELADIDTRLADARDRLQASVVGTITLNAGEMMQLRMEGARYAQSIARILRVEVQRGGKYAIGGGGGYLPAG